MIKKLKSLLEQITLNQWVLLLLALLYILLHFASHTSIYAARNDDVSNVLPLLHKLQNPSLYPNNKLAEHLFSIHKKTRVLYYYLLTYPLSFFLHPGRVLSILGILFALLVWIFTGGGWRGEDDLLRAVLILAVFIHLSMEVNPLMGIMRSFAVVSLACLFWLEERGHRWFVVGLIGLTSGIYAPAGLVLLMYVAVKTVFQNPNGLLKPRSVGYVGLCFLALLTALSPYLMNLFDPSQSLATNWVPPIRYELGSLTDILKTFIFGWGRGAMFMTPSTRSVFMVFGSLGLLQWVVLGNREIQVRPFLLYALVSALILWFIANIFHPHLYHPNRYTRATLPFLVSMFFIDNLKPFSDKLSAHFNNRRTLGWLLLILTFVPAYLYWERVLERPYNIINEFHFLSDIYMGKVWEGFIFGFPLILTCLLIPIPRTNNTEWKPYVVLLLLCAFLFYPHCFTTCGNYTESGQPISYYHELFETFEETPVDALVAGPPSLMDPVMAYGRRNVFFRHEQKDIMFVCQRIKEFVPIYFADQAQLIMDYVVANNIDYLLVDRQDFQDRSVETCGADLPPLKSPVLDRNFHSFQWTKDGRYYLLSPADLRKTFELPTVGNALKNR